MQKSFEYALINALCVCVSIERERQRIRKINFQIVYYEKPKLYQKHTKAAHNLKYF